jgi:uncharacterized membrane protein
MEFTGVVTGMGDNEARTAPPGDSSAPEVMDGIQSLHDRMDALHQLVAERLAAEGVHAGEWLHERAATVHVPPLPAWRRSTQGELRYPASLTTALAIGLQVAIPDRLVLLKPSWVLPAVQGALLLVLISANPHRINRRSRMTRMASLALGVILMLANGWSVASLAVGITQGKLGQNAGQLLITGGVIWVNNVIVFALWYWELDRGGPVARALNLGNPYPDFQFAQMVSPPEMVPPDWEPHFLDYLYLAFTNAAAFSPTDVMPMTRWAKMAMTVQSIISIVTVALVVSRAVNILPGG